MEISARSNAEGEMYEGMNREDKMLAELQSQTSSIKNIQSNVQFFFWITIIGIVSQILIYVYLTK
jgi:hypothetical protein